MSMKNMSSKINNTEITFNFSNENTKIINNINSSINNKKSINLRNQINFVCTELLKREENKNYDNISILGENTQDRKKRELEIKIANEEKRINDLEKMKKEKLIKVKNTKIKIKNLRFLLKIKK